MRLNENSMQKLFDLMLMGFKMQCVQACYPEELMHMTIRHLDQVHALVDAGSEAAEVVNKTKLQFVMLVNQFNAYDFVVVK